MASSEGQDVGTLLRKLSGLESKYEDLEKKFNAISATLLHKLIVEDKKPNSDTSKEPDLGKNDDASSTKAVKGDDESKEDDLTSTGRVRIVVNKIDPETGERLDMPPKKSSKDVDESGRALTLRKITYSERESYLPSFSEIDIHDNGLWELLKSKLGYYPYHTFQGKPTTLKSPYEPLVHNWDELRGLASEEVDGEDAQKARKDLGLLLDTILSGSGDEKLDRYLKTREAGKNQDTVTFDNLWTLFPPGQLIYGKPFQDQHEIFLVQDSYSSWPASKLYPGHDRAWELLCWVYDWNGKNFYRSSLTLKFDPFEGQKSIVSLPFYPLDLHDKKNEIRKQLVERGKKFRELCRAKELGGSQMFQYKGNAIFGRKGFSMSGSENNDDENRSHSNYEYDPWLNTVRRQSSFGAEHSKPPSKPTAVDSRVMVDVLAYTSYGPSGGTQVGSLLPNQEFNECRCEECKHNTRLAELYMTHFDSHNNVKGEWSSEQYMLCPPRVLGYILSDKQWAQLQVDFVDDIRKDGSDEAWKTRLRLADEDEKRQNSSSTKDMLLKLVESHSSSESNEKSPLEVDDIIARKGKGLVILLYGPPGVGKTSTAETLALATRKPLFSISVADVGTQAKHAEANLSKIFDLASSWQAILLIDEADVFLESRQRGAGSSVDRNALVSVFLRVLEYYQGILILTTNQIAQFDVAVQSRVHIAIEYTTLNRAQKERIFEGFLLPLHKQGLIPGYKEITDWLEESVYDAPNLDGRQIRNIVTSALGLARAMGDTYLKKSHLVPVFRNTNNFKRAYEREFENYKASQNKMIK